MLSAKRYDCTVNRHYQGPGQSLGTADSPTKLMVWAAGPHAKHNLKTHRNALALTDSLMQLAYFFILVVEELNGAPASLQAGMAKHILINLLIIYILIFFI